MIKDEHFEVVGVVTQPDRPAGRKLQLKPSPVKALVQALGIPVLTPESVNTPEALAAIVKWRAEVVVVVAYGQLLAKNFLDLYPQRVVNVHASLLPRWRGAAPVQRALTAGDKETGVSLQIIVRKMDAGPLLGYRQMPLSSEMNAVDVLARIPELAKELISIELMDYLRGNLTPVEQDETQVTMAPKISKEEAVIDWQWPAERIHNLIRGMAAGPVASTSRAGRMVKIHISKVVSSSRVSSAVAGTLVAQGASGLHVVCGQGELEILKLQPESRGAMASTEYLRGYPIQQGDVFGPSESVSRRS
jgi:methionyl-tRNA formyltransferase